MEGFGWLAEEKLAGSGALIHHKELMLGSQ